MHLMNRRVIRPQALALFCAFAASPALALGPGSIGFDAFSYGIDFGFAYGQTTATPNGFDSITVNSFAAPGGDAFGGIGVSFDTIGGAPGLNFDPAEYELEMSYKLLPGNAADFVNIQIGQRDGGGQSETFNYGLANLNAEFANGTPDADGFVTIVRDLTELPNPVTGSPSDPWDFVFGNGDGAFDTNVVQNGIANSITQLQLQTTDGANAVAMELKALRLKEKSPTGITQIDAGGWNRAYSAFDSPGAITRDNGVDAFTNVVVDVDEFGGALQRALPSVEVFDGTTHSVEVVARRLPGNVAANFTIGLGDLDGNDTAEGEGADNYFYVMNTADFSDTEFTTVTVPITVVTPSGDIPFGFSNAGDGSATEFNLYELQLTSTFGGEDRLNMEFASIRIVETPPTVTGDYNGDGVVNAADYTVYRDNEGGGAAVFAVGSRDAAASGPISQADYNAWANNFGATAATAAAAAIPEPAAALSAIAACGLAARRRLSAHRV